jgi:hypothetical protein
MLKFFGTSGRANSRRLTMRISSRSRFMVKYSSISRCTFKRRFMYFCQTDKRGPQRYLISAALPRSFGYCGDFLSNIETRFRYLNLQRHRLLLVEIANVIPNLPNVFRRVPWKDVLCEQRQYRSVTQLVVA